MKSARFVVLSALCAGIAEGLKLALATIPNVECVSLTIALFASVFGPVGIVGAVVFVGIEILLYGVSVWTISYMVYWPILAVVFMLIGRGKLLDKIYMPPIIIALCTFAFGVLSSVADVAIMGGFDDFVNRLGAYYVGGITFYVVHIVSNAIIFAVLFTPLRRIMLSHSSQNVQKTAK